MCFGIAVAGFVLGTVLTHGVAGWRAEIDRAVVAHHAGGRGVVADGGILAASALRDAIPIVGLRVDTPAHRAKNTVVDARGGSALDRAGLAHFARSHGRASGVVPDLAVVIAPRDALLELGADGVPDVAADVVF